MAIQKERPWALSVWRPMLEISSCLLRRSERVFLCQHKRVSVFFFVFFRGVCLHFKERGRWKGRDGEFVFEETECTQHDTAHTAALCDYVQGWQVVCAGSLRIGVLHSTSGFRCSNEAEVSSRVWQTASGQKQWNKTTKVINNFESVRWRLSFPCTRTCTCSVYKSE